MKKCYKCQIEQPYSGFHRCKSNKDGYQDACKDCRKEYARVDRTNHREKYNDRASNWRIKNKEKCLKREKIWRDNNKDKINKGWQKYYNKNKEKLLKRNKENYWKDIDENRAKQRESAKKNHKQRSLYKKDYTRENKDKVNLRRRKYRKNNPEKFEAYYRDPKNNLDARMSSHIRISLKGNKNGRSWESLVGYTNIELMKHLESQFTSDMNWERFSKGEIVVDHIICKELFEYSYPEEEQFKICWALSNLQPLFFNENAAKGDLLPDSRRARFLTKQEKLDYLNSLGYNFERKE